MNNKRASLFSSTLLIAGTSVGAGMLALPTVTAQAGLFPALCITTLCWLYMMATGYLFLEATLWMHEGANVLSMSERFLGSVGKWISGAAFIFLYYALHTSYLSGGTAIILSAETFAELNLRTAVILFSSFFALLIFLGTRIVNTINSLLMVAATISFGTLLVVGSDHVQYALMKTREWPLALLAMPTLLSAFGYHNIIPTLTFYTKRNRILMRRAIFLGTLIPLIIYCLWQWIVIGSLTENQINEAATNGVPVTQALEQATHHSALALISSFFGLFAIITSLLGISLSMVDFLGDGFNLRRTGWQRFILTLIVFIPSTLFVETNPALFNEAIALAGGYGEAILNGLLPIGLVWSGRYCLLLKTERELKGGKLILFLLFIVTLIVIAIETSALVADPLR